VHYKNTEVKISYVELKGIKNGELKRMHRHDQVNCLLP
jgi:hypothetical protein